MSARKLAVCCLLLTSFETGRAESRAPTGAPLELYLSAEVRAAAPALDEMRSELGLLMRSAGYAIQWREGDGPSDGELGELVVVHLRGVCAAPEWRAALKPVKNLQSLASSSVVDGKVLPFTWVECAALSRFVGPSLKHQKGSSRDRVYGRAMARLLAHELYHVLARNTAHTQGGIAKPRFTIDDLTADHLEFEPEAVDQMQR
jgi:hypothetical protein